MQIITREYTKLVVAALAGIFVSVVALGLLISNDSEAAVTEVQNEKQAVYLSTSTIPVRVSGVVKAAKSTVVYAQTAGVVTDLPVREGTVVAKGQVLAVQATPVVDARLALASAERGLSGLDQTLNSEMRSGQAVQAAYRAYSASEIASLRAVSNDTRIQEGGEALLTGLEQSVLAITSSVNYVNNNRSLFSANGLQIYDEVISGLYGEAPDYFRGSTAVTGVSTNDLQTMLKEVKETNDPATLKTLSLLVNGQLTALTKLFATGESDVFERNSSYVTESMLAEYMTERTAVLSAAQSLQSTSAAFAQVIDRVLEDGVAQQTNVNVSDIDRELALRQASYAAAIAAQADVVAAAGEGVVAAHRELGRPKASFAGTVSRVFVDEGQYVMPGTPLLTLVGSGARELEVSVPSYLLSGIQTGQTFMIDGNIIGFVDRFSTVSESGSGVVVLSLTIDAVPVVGMSLVGDLEVMVVGEVYQVPRSYVHFDADGAYVVYEDGASSRVRVVYDTGRLLFIEVDEFRPVPLQAAVSISL